MGLFDRNPEGGALAAPMVQSGGGGGGGIAWSDPVDSNITFDAHDTYAIGSAALAPSSVYAGSGGFITDDGAGINTSIYQGGMGSINATNQFWIELYSNTDPDGASNVHGKVYTDGGATPSLDIFSAEKLWLRATSNIALYSGAASTFRFQKTGVANTIGDVWTATGVNGEGYWAAPGGGGFDPDTSPVQFLNTFIEMSDAAGDWWTGSNTKIQNGNAMTDGTLVIGTRDLLTGGDVKKNIALLTGSQDGGPNGGTGQIDLITGYVETGTGSSGNFFITTGGVNTGVTGNSGQFEIQTGDNSGTGNSGQWMFRTGNADGGNSGSVSFSTGVSSAGNSGNIILSIGTATGTQGVFRFLKSGVPSVAGQVWTASGTDGTGYWATLSAASSGSAGAIQLSDGSSGFTNDSDFSYASDILNVGQTKVHVSQTHAWWGSAAPAILIDPDTITSDHILFGSKDSSTGSNVYHAILVRSGQVTGASATAGSGEIYIGSGDVSGSAQASGAVELRSGNATGNSGHVNLLVGTSGATRGDINMDGRHINLNSLIFNSQIAFNGSNTLRLQNNVFLLSRNAANSANINLLKVNASDNAELGAPVVFLNLASDPSSPQAGMVYYNTTSNKLKMYNGSTWETITSA